LTLYTFYDTMRR